jgi:hypothetical protein
VKNILIILLVLLMAGCTAPYGAVQEWTTSAKVYYGLSTDTKPSVAAIGSRFTALNTGQTWITDNGTNWYPEVGADTPTVYNVLISDNNTQFSQAIPDGTRLLIFSGRSNLAFYYAYATGKVAGPTSPYLSCSENATVKLEGIVTDNLTLYLARPSSDNITVEIQCWSR